MVQVLTYPASVITESNLIRIQSDILVNSGKKICTDNSTTHANRLGASSCNTVVLFS